MKIIMNVNYSFFSFAKLMPESCDCPKTFIKPRLQTLAKCNGSRAHLSLQVIESQFVLFPRLIGFSLHPARQGDNFVFYIHHIAPCKLLAFTFVDGLGHYHKPILWALLFIASLASYCLGPRPSGIPEPEQKQNGAINHKQIRQEFVYFFSSAVTTIQFIFQSILRFIISLHRIKLNQFVISVMLWFLCTFQVLHMDYGESNGDVHTFFI
jgi:hypothetical protein